MTVPRAKETRISSKEALKMIYYVIIGLAITEALNRTLPRIVAIVRAFLTLQWPQIFALDNSSSIILLLALLPTICRFVHGASIHLDIYSEKRYKPLGDFIGFFFQSSVFYLMAASLDSPLVFSFFFCLVLLGDAIWLISLISARYIKCEMPTKQWLWSDIVIIIALVTVFVIDRTMAGVMSVMAILTIALVATILDYFLNKDFYFPSPKGHDSA